MGNKLKPCPFCGGPAKLYYAPANLKDSIPCFGVSCECCKTMIGTVRTGATDFFRTPGEAKTAWNKRMPELPGTEASAWAQTWANANVQLPPVERVEKDEGIEVEISVPVLGLLEDGSRIICRRIDESGGFINWHGWIEVQSSGTVELTHWIELPLGPKEADKS